jgi:phosphoribosylglycinamide formyltransferase 1
VAASRRSPIAPVLVISNRADAAGLERAAAAHIATQVIPHAAYPDRAGFETALTQALEAAQVDLVCLAGFMRLLTPQFVNRWHDRLINVHPSLLPAFPGLNTHGRALAAGVRFTGCTIHFVRADMDAGPIILQATVPVHEEDTEASLAARVLAAEHRCYPAAVRWIAEGRISIEGERVRVKGRANPPPPAVNPAIDG